ncbi:hypothetical protein BB561_002354 [Smittium simulii]|uniref:N-acetyltransferase domain-containing protein n=1 Tax=Smittium simulii TaxID=133385 RepID=A0A2T9YQU1_9FUNG|nr:hypothetical protein BB561_002354 [Smittium simulii]
MIQIRQARVDDYSYIQNCNLHNLPENYQQKYFLYHALSWPQLTHVAETPAGEIVGYVLAKLEDEDKAAPKDPKATTNLDSDSAANSAEQDSLRHGHITSISVMRKYRRLGLAKRLMIQSQQAMKAVYKAHKVSLHVRVSNKAAINLYTKKLSFTVDHTEEKYYADGEDAFAMNLIL